jgi:hypothetical protein
MELQAARYLLFQVLVLGAVMLSLVIWKKVVFGKERAVVRKRAAEACVVGCLVGIGARVSLGVKNDNLPYPWCHTHRFLHVRLRNTTFIYILIFACSLLVCVYTTSLRSRIGMRVAPEV